MRSYLAHATAVQMSPLYNAIIDRYLALEGFNSAIWRFEPRHGSLWHMTVLSLRWCAGLRLLLLQPADFGAHTAPCRLWSLLPCSF